MSQEASASFADTIRQKIARSGRTVNAVAVAARVPQPVLSRFVRGERGINLSTAEKLCRVLGLGLRGADDLQPTHAEAPVAIP